MYPDVNERCISRPDDVKSGMGSANSCAKLMEEML